MEREAREVTNRRAYVHQLVLSDTFRNSHSLSKLLTYLAEKSMAGEADDLKEFTIGVEALGKDASYDPQADATVRVQVGRLRQKLVEYYANEGASDPMVVTVPKGHFKVAFEQPRANGVGAHAVARWRFRCLALGIAAAVLAFLALVQRFSASSGEPARAAQIDEYRELWAPYFHGDRTVLISVGTPLFWRVGGFYLRDFRVSEPFEAKAHPELGQVRGVLGGPDAVPVQNFVGVGDSVAAFLLGKHLLRMGVDAEVRRNSELTWDDIRTNNLVFVGAPKFNTHLRYALETGDFAIDGDAIANPRPMPGEQSSYIGTRTEDNTRPIEDYALIRRVPGLHGQGYATVLASGTTYGSWAAVEFCTQPAYARELVHVLRNGTDSIPEFFEVIVKGEFREGHPVKVAYVTHRAIERPESASARR